MNWTIDFMPLVSREILWAAAALVAVLSVAILWSGRRGALLRVLSLVTLLVAIANPNFIKEQREILPNIAVIAVDASTSQTLGGREARAAELRTDLEAKLKAIPNVQVRVVESVKAAETGKEETALFSGLNHGLSDVPPDRLAGVFLITDGQIHDAPTDPASIAPGAPVHTLLNGSPDERDARVEVVSAPRFGLVGSDQVAEIKLERQGGAVDGPATLKIHRENEPVETLDARFGETVKVRFPFKHAGQTIMEVELAPEPGELTLANNRAVIAAEGVRENLRVLLVSGEPHAGERTWRNLLRSDASVDLVHFTILRPPEKHDGTPPNQLSLIAFPTRELFSEKLNDFDLIIFDRYQRRGVLPLIYLDNVARYVQKGGAVLVAAGEDFASTQSLSKTPLANVLPARPTGRVIEEAFRPRVTATGVKHPVTSGLPGAGAKDQQPSWGRWLRVVETDSSGGDVVMTGAQDAPLLVLSREGEGRVAVLLSDHAWLWARGYDGGGPHADLLRRLSHWLMKEPDLEEEWLRASGEAKRLKIVRRSMKDSVGQATVTLPSGKTETVALAETTSGMWDKTLDATEAGVYRVEMDGLSTIALVGAVNSREFAKVTTTDAVAKPVGDATGGGVFWMGAGDSAKAAMPRLAMMTGAKKMHGGGWIGLRDRKPHLVRSVSYTPLFTGFAALALLLGFLGMTWWREGR
ncbi:MAG: hypothetical protein SGJ17_13430 [Hyphomicrobiales bacterium]|nr:hypothetical protein [Hyphomicrobiales bacterium]